MEGPRRLVSGIEEDLERSGDLSWAVAPKGEVIEITSVYRKEHTFIKTSCYLIQYLLTISKSPKTCWMINLNI